MTDRELPNVREAMSGCMEQLDEKTSDSVKWMVAHFYVRDGLRNKDGSRGSFRMDGHRSLADLLAYAVLSERERCARKVESATILNDWDQKQLAAAIRAGNGREE